MSTAQLLDEAERYQEAAQAYEAFISEYGPEMRHVGVDPLWPYVRLAALYAERLERPERAIELYRFALSRAGPTEWPHDQCVEGLRALGAAPAPRTSRRGTATVGVQWAADLRFIRLFESWGYRVEAPPPAGPTYQPVRFGARDIEYLVASPWGRYSAADLDHLRHHLFVGGRALVIVRLADHPVDSIRQSPGWMLAHLGVGVGEPAVSFSGDTPTTSLTSHPLADAVGSPPRVLGWLPLEVPQAWVVARIDADPVIAAGRFGLGRVVLVSLGAFYLFPDQYSHLPEPEHKALAERNQEIVRAALDWLMKPRLPSEEALAARFLDAERKENAGDHAGAAALLEAIWREQPDTSYGREAKYWLGQMLREVGDKDSSAGHYRQLLDVAPASALARPAQIALGELAEEAGDFEQAGRWYAQAAGETRDHHWLDAHLHQALCWLKRDRFAEAAGEFRLVVDNQADGDERVRALFGGAYCYERLGRTWDAARLYRHLANAYAPGTWLPTQLWPDPFDRYLGPQCQRCVSEAARHKLESLYAGGA